MSTARKELLIGIALLACAILTLSLNVAVLSPPWFSLSALCLQLAPAAIQFNHYLLKRKTEEERRQMQRMEAERFNRAAFSYVSPPANSPPAALADEPDEPDEPMVVPALIRGWRAWTCSYDKNSDPAHTYFTLGGVRLDLQPGQTVLVGGAGGAWTGASLAAECSDIFAAREDWASTEPTWSAAQAELHLRNGECPSVIGRGCGIYVLNEPDELTQPLASDLNTPYGVVLGTVVCWGVIVPYEKGYRVQHAEIEKLYVFWPRKDHLYAARLRERYGVPVRVVRCTHPVQGRFPGWRPEDYPPGFTVASHNRYCALCQTDLDTGEFRRMASGVLTYLNPMPMIVAMATQQEKEESIVRKV